MFILGIELSETDRWAMIAMLAVLGGVLGSFMNVVVYRLPRGISLLFPPSQCPVCHEPISWRDNVPVLGWLMLRGRCRKCQVAISPRYPIVEGLVAVISALVAWKEAAFPVPPPTGFDNWYVLDLAPYFFHLFFLCTLVCIALIEFDGYVPPRSLMARPVFVVVPMAIFWPSLLPRSDWLQMDGLPAAIAGIGAALLISLPVAIALFMTVDKNRVRYAGTAVGELVLVGAFLGDNAVLSIAMVTMVLFLLTQWLALRWKSIGRIGYAGLLTLVSLVWVLSWPEVLAFDLSFSQEPLTRLIISGGVVIFLAVLLQLVPPPLRSLERAATRRR